MDVVELSPEQLLGVLQDVLSGTLKGHREAGFSDHHYRL